MTNVQFKLDGDKLVITVDLTQRHGLSASGKTISIGSTSGNAKLTGKHANVSFGLNVYTKDGVEAAKAKQAA